MMFNRTVALVLCLLLSACSLYAEHETVCFIGDSITAMWNIQDYFPEIEIKKYAARGAVVNDMEKWNLSECKGIKSVLLIGTNDLAKKKYTSTNVDSILDSFVADYIRHAALIQGSPTIVVSVMPRLYWGKTSPKKNKIILRANKMLNDSLSASDDKYKFVDVYDLFVTNEFGVQEQYFKDGLHPNANGYRRLTSALEKYIYQ